jgi:hypothetical protein
VCEVCISEALSSNISRGQFEASTVVQIAAIVIPESLFIDVTEEMEWFN